MTLLRERHYPAKLLNALFPPQCMSCGELVGTHGTLCHDCWSDLSFITKPGCAICAHPFDFDLGDDALCASCIDQLPVFDEAYSALRFDDTSKRLLHKLKFEDQGHLAPILAEWLANYMRHKPAVDMVIPVPLSRKRLFHRRYNQSALVAQELAQRLGCGYAPSILQRVRHTTPQTGLTKLQRQENVRGAFAVPDAALTQLTSKQVCLVDDVMTTGATINACCKALKKAGASRVVVLTLARVVRE